MNILHVCADPQPVAESASKKLAAAFFTKLTEQQPEAEINNVDLYEDPPPYLSYEAYCGFWNPIMIDGYSPTDHEMKAMEYGLKQGDIVNAADVLVLTMPMWGFSIPGILKSWMDFVFSPGKTFELSTAGVKPLHKIRKAVLLVASGDTFKEDDPRDALTRQVEAQLAYVGIDDVSIAWADGQYPLLYSDGQVRLEMALEAAEDLAEEVAELTGAGV